MQWRGENDLKADYDRVNIRSESGRLVNVSVIPDSYFVLQTPLGVAHFFLELDRGTMTVKRFKNKIVAYQTY
ncbi:MAG: replication-relaxation family protein [Chloroflexi bacterium]|nr:replication-relaxation family protein [Chloroflexota bacterium]